MNKDVLLHISGLHYVNGDEDAEPVELIAPAEYYNRNGKHYILYNEHTEDLSGMTKIKIKIADEYVEITKKGATHSQLLFEKGKKNLTCYDTAFGSLTLGVTATNIDFQLETSKLSLAIDYLLEANYEPLADCCLELQVTNKEASLFSLTH